MRIEEYRVVLKINNKAISPKHLTSYLIAKDTNCSLVIVTLHIDSQEKGKIGFRYLGNEGYIELSLCSKIARTFADINILCDVIREASLGGTISYVWNMNFIGDLNESS